MCIRDSLLSPEPSNECKNATSGHRDHTAPAGYVSTESYLLVHQPIPPKEFMKIPEAKKAVDAEWEKLTSQGAWDLTTVREFSEVKSQARAQGRTVHFGRVFPLCHKKNAEMSSEHWKCKGRVVFGGNNVYDQNGWGAVFSEQSTSASHHTAGKWLDALARAPGMSGQDSDAASAYTQARLQGNETWIELPPAARPKSWDKYVRPACQLKLALYGHPLAGLYWESHCKHALKSCGFSPVPSWECMHYNKDQKLFLSIYADDFKLAGKRENIAPMWKKLKEFLTLDPPTEFHGGKYLGQVQSDVVPDQALSERQNLLWKHLFADDRTFQGVCCVCYKKGCLGRCPNPDCGLLMHHSCVMPVAQGGNQQCTICRTCLLYTSPSPRDRTRSRMPSSA